MMPGMPEKRTHDYVRHGTVDLFAAFDIATGVVIAKTYKSHRAKEWIKFLEEIDKQVPQLAEPTSPAASRMCCRSTSSRTITRRIRPRLSSNGWKSTPGST